MKRFSILLAVLIVAATLSLTGTMNAQPGGGGRGKGGSNSGGRGNGGNHNAGKGNNGNNNVGKGNAGNNKGGQGNLGVGKGGQEQGTRFRSRSYRGWTRYAWLASYRSYLYYSPDDSAWYYWYGPGDCYRPVSDIASYLPDESTPPSLPPGATSVP
jgi:hypothetical protein